MTEVRRVHHFLTFVDRLISEEALGRRIATAPSATRTPVAPFTLEDIEAICRFVWPRELLSIRLNFFGKPIPAAAFLDPAGFYDFAKIARLHEGGATLIANQVHTTSRAIACLAGALGRRLHCHAGVNCYATPARAQGFARHVDSHDVIIAQLQGRKAWQLCSRASRAGLEYTMDGFDHEAPCEERVLGPGDLLYIPAGFVHAARSIPGATSIHLTIGFVPPTWRTLLASWVSATAAADNALDEPVPAEALRDGSASTATAAAARARLERVAALPFDAARNAVTARRAKHAPPAGPPPRSCRPEDVHDDLLLRKPAGVAARMFAGVLRIDGPDGWSLHLRQECAAAWRVIDSRDTMRPRDLAGTVTGGHERLLCQLLLENGFLEIAETTED